MAVDSLWIALLALAILGIFPNAASLAQGFRMRGQVRRAMRLAHGAHVPLAVVILPIRGLDDGLDENLRAILSQSYPAYRVLVVVDDSKDPVATHSRDVAKEFPKVGLETVVSEESELRGKVNALRSGLSHLDPRDEVIVFADADIRPGPDWLRQLVQPLADPSVGVATGFRWYIPPRPTFWSLVRAEWNAVSANVLFDPKRAFAWGGSCAIRRSGLPLLRLETRWRGVLSDDLVLTEAVRDAGLGIAYAPAALVPTFEGGTRATCLEWCLRQMTMATLYLPVVRRYAVAAFALFDGSILFGVASLVAAIFLGPLYVIPAVLFFAPVPTAIAKAYLRRRALFPAAPGVAAAWRVPPWRITVAVLAVPWVMAWGLLRTRHPKTVRWRGRLYSVENPRQVRLIDLGTKRQG